MGILKGVVSWRRGDVKAMIEVVFFDDFIDICR